MEEPLGRFGAIVCDLGLPRRQWRRSGRLRLCLGFRPFCGSTLVLALLKACCLEEALPGPERKEGDLPLDNGEFVGTVGFGVPLFTALKERSQCHSMMVPGECPCQGGDCTAYEG